MQKNIENQVPQVVINGIGALNKAEKIIKRKLTFDFEDLDQADELRQTIATARNDLFNYNQIIRNSKIQQLQQQAESNDTPQPDTPEPDKNPPETTEPVKENEDED